MSGSVIELSVNGNSKHTDETTHLISSQATPCISRKGLLISALLGVSAILGITLGIHFGRNNSDNNNGPFCPRLPDKFPEFFAANSEVARSGELCLPLQNYDLAIFGYDKQWDAWLTNLPAKSEADARNKTLEFLAPSNGYSGDGIKIVDNESNTWSCLYTNVTAPFWKCAASLTVIYDPNSSQTIGQKLRSSVSSLFSSASSFFHTRVSGNVPAETATAAPAPSNRR